LGDILGEYEMRNYLKQKYAKLLKSKR